MSDDRSSDPSEAPCSSACAAALEGSPPWTASPTSGPTSAPSSPSSPGDDLVARTLSFFSSAAAEASSGGRDEIVVRRVIIARRRWDELVEIAEELRRKRGLVTSPSEVAAIVIEAGLMRIRDMVVSSAPASATPSSSSPPTPKPVPMPTIAPAPMSARPAPSTPPSAPEPSNSSSLTPRETSELARLVRGRTSQRSVQRVLGLWLGVRSNGEVATEALRDLCRQFRVYNTANFAQNMKKDAVCFEPVVAGASAHDPALPPRRAGWRLTPDGWERARNVLGSALVTRSARPEAAPDKAPDKAEEALAAT